MKIAISQSNYIPWKGYFDMISEVDCFVLYDSVQYTKRDWRNRNLIKTSEGLKWLTIPVEVKGKYTQNICDTRIADVNWAKKHWAIIQQAYSKATYFKEVSEWLKPLYMNCQSMYLSEINTLFISTIKDFLKIDTLIKSSSEYDFDGDKNQKLISICDQLNAKEYLSGPAAKEYINIDQFEQEGISVKFKSYENYLTYDQLYPPFCHTVSIIDLIFNTGDNAKFYYQNGNINR